MKFYRHDILGSLAISLWLFSFQVGLHSQNLGRLVVNWRFWLSDRSCYILIFPELRCGNYPVYVLWGIVIALVAFD